MPLASAAINLQSGGNSVAEKSLEYKVMEQKWELPEALLSGTPGMREAGELYLPKNRLEQNDDYLRRLQKTFLYNAYGDTVQKLSDKPFQKPVVLDGAESLPEELQGIEDNVDFTGRNLTDFAHDLVDDGTIYGKTHILVDFPKTDNIKNLKDKRAIKPRPSFIHVTARDLIGWQIEKNDQGISELTQIRYCEQSVEADGDYGDKLVIRIRVWTKTAWEIWEQTEIDRGEGKTDVTWTMTEEGVNSLGFIPLITMYFKREGILISGVPLEDLAWVNLEHWQSSSEQRNILHVVRIATLFAKGFPEDQIKNGITISANGMIAAENPEADLKWVEHNGHALESGTADLKSLENRMEVLGLQPLIQKSANSTATGSVISEGKANTKIQAWVRVTEGAILRAYEVAAQWVNSEIPDDFAVNVFNDFGVSLRDSAELATLLAARLNEEIDHKTFINELRRRGVLNESIDAESISNQLDDEQEDELNKGNKNFLDEEDEEDEETEEEKLKREEQERLQKEIDKEVAKGGNE